jgi:hypothetical protein
MLSQQAFDADSWMSHSRGSFPAGSLYSALPFLLTVDARVSFPTVSGACYAGIHFAHGLQLHGSNIL